MTKKPKLSIKRIPFNANEIDQEHIAAIGRYTKDPNTTKIIRFALAHLAMALADQGKQQKAISLMKKIVGDHEVIQ